MRSSYEQNDFDDVFFAIIRAFQPINCVELGVLDGYSAVCIAAGLIKNGRGELNAYDLFEDYAYKHGSLDDVRQTIKRFDFEKIITLHQRDAYEVYKDYQGRMVDFLHVDISNTGETVERIMEQWDPMMPRGGVICFEGGTEERDKVEWMIKYNARPMKPEIENNKIIADKYIFGTYLKFPGLTMLLKKKD